MADADTLTPVDAHPWDGYTLTPVDGDPFAEPLTIHASNWKGPKTAGATDSAASAMPGEGSPAGPLQRAYPPDPARGYVTPVETEHAAPDVLGAVSSFLYGNPQGFATSADQLARGSAGLPAQYGANTRAAFGASSNLANQGVANLKEGDVVAGVPQTIAGTIGQVMAPLTGGYETAAEDMDPFLQPDAAHPVAHAAPHAASASDILPAVLGGIGAKAKAGPNEADLILRRMAAKYGEETSLDDWSAPDRNAYFDAVDRMMAPAAPSVEERIRSVVDKLQGTPQRDSVRLSELRKELPDIDRAALDKELVRLFEEGHANLMGLSNPVEIVREEPSAINYKGVKQHVLWMKPPRSGSPPFTLTPVDRDPFAE